MSTTPPFHDVREELHRISEIEVMNFLQQRPDFFDTHPQALADIKLQHDSGKAVSLIERQVAVLRDQRKKLKKQLQELVDIAHENDDLNRRLHQLTLRLIDCRRLSDVFEMLKHHLQRDFTADAVTLRLRPVPQRPELNRYAEFGRELEEGFEGYARIVQEQKPLCGRFKSEQIQLLFPSHAGVAIASAAVIPLNDAPVFGVLAVGSVDERRFHADQGTVFLAQLSALVSRALRVCITE